MPFELQYTSAPHGLSLGESGFATVKMTKGLPLSLREALESLSSYHYGEAENKGSNGRHLCSSLLHVTAGGNRWCVLSRSADAGLDHTHRHNFFVHHIAFSPDETHGIDPISLLNASNFLQSKWDGRVEELAIRPPIQNGAGTSPAQHPPDVLTDDWKNAIVDEALAGKITYVIAPDRSVLGVAESLLAATPPEDRWNITFITHFHSLPPAAKCGIRCIAPNSAKLRNLNRSDTLIVDLTKPLGPAPASRRIAIAHVTPSPNIVTASLPASRRQPTRQRTSGAPNQEYRPAGLSWESSFEDVASERPRPNHSFGVGIAFGAIVGLVLALVLAVPVFMLLQSRIARIRDERNAFESNLAKLQDEVKAMQTNQQEQAKEFDALKKVAKQDIQQLQDNNDSLKQLILEEKRNITDRDLKIASLQLSIGALKRQRLDSHKDIKDLNSKNNVLAQQLEQSKKLEQQVAQKEDAAPGASTDKAKDTQAKDGPANSNKTADPPVKNQAKLNTADNQNDATQIANSTGSLAKKSTNTFPDTSYQDPAPKSLLPDPEQPQQTQIVLSDKRDSIEMTIPPNYLPAGFITTAGENNPRTSFKYMYRSQTTSFKWVEVASFKWQVPKHLVLFEWQHELNSIIPDRNERRKIWIALSTASLHFKFGDVYDAEVKLSGDGK